MMTDVETWIRGLTFVPIVLCSVIGFALTLWKWRQVRQPNQIPDRVLAEVRARIRAGEGGAALELVRSDQSRASRLLEYVLAQPGRTGAMVRERTRYGGGRLAHDLEYGLGGLTLIATLGPLLGLLGTVVGITMVFERLAETGGVATPQQLAGGIGTALQTTLAGLVVGVLALVSHRYLSARVDHIVTQLEAVGMDIVELLGGEDR